MKIIPAEQYPQRDQKALLDFLTLCREQAVRRGEAVLASIALKVRHIDPLAVLQSIYEQGQLHFYQENPQVDEAIAGAEAVVSATFEGEDRFAAVQAFIRQTLDCAVAIGDMDAPFSGPHFFCAFTFAAEADGNDHFAPATVFVPRWQVARHSDGYTAVANILITERSNLRLEAARVLAAHSKFLRFDYTIPAASGTGAKPAPVSTKPEPDGTKAAPDSAYAEVGGEGFYLNAVSEALRRIRAGKYEKIVLARMLDLHSPTALHPLEALNRLRERYPSCYAFSFANGRGQSFIGSSPERLLRVQAGKVLTEALAGSAPRSHSAGEDARLGSELLHSDKDLREHELVRAAIVANLISLGVRMDATPTGPRLRKLANLQHLWTPLSGTLPAGCGLLDIAALLHPTPAVGGVPRAAACPDVARLEAAPRGLYTGAMGWVDARGDGEMVVALRSGLIDGCRARLYAGAGIVEGSAPQSELRETALKFRPLLESLGMG